MIQCDQSVYLGAVNDIAIIVTHSDSCIMCQQMVHTNVHGMNKIIVKWRIIDNTSPIVFIDAGHRSATMFL